MSEAPLSKAPLTEGIDYTIDSDTGLMVLTREYLEKQGKCCNSGCINCPYGVTVRDPDERDQKPS